MRSFFCRHTERLDVLDQAIESLFATGTLAIHFPERDRHPEGDCESTNPDDYETAPARRAVATLNEIARYGGCTWAQYRRLSRHHPGYSKRVMVNMGIIMPQQIRLYRTRWKSRDREAVLKTLRMAHAFDIPDGEEMELRRIRPKAGTIAEWHAVGDRLCRLIETRTGRSSQAQNTQRMSAD